VPKEPVIFNASIQKNISFGKTDFSAEQLYRAAYLAQALCFIEDNNETDDKKRLETINFELKSVITNLIPMFRRFDGLI
jgi:ABC-type multidrug transport system fused ATPase/permease subunit